MKRFADLSITEGVLTQMLFNTILADETQGIILVADGNALCKATRRMEDLEKVYNDYIFMTMQVLVTTESESDGGEILGQIILVHGNEEDLISDYSTTLEHVVRPVLNFIDGKQAA